MRYFFECGNFSDISLAELSAVFQSYGISKDCIKKTLNKSIFLIESNSVNPEILDRIFNRLGGYIRYGEIIEDLDKFLEPYFERKKVTFGISVIGDINISIKDIQKLANDIKRNFRSRDISSRFILPKKKELNAAQLINNGVLNEGFELCIFDISDRMYAKTLGIQDINSFVKRDIERPNVDFDMGVLPQKLARILCNLTGLHEGILWDPFCGSGTILMEASVLGFDVLGSDIDLGAIEDTSKNIKWLSSEGYINHVKYNVFQLDIHNVERRILKDLKKTNINCVVCEPYMGPPQQREMSQENALKLIEDVKRLYISLFNVLEEVGKKGFKVVLILPSYKTKKGWITFNISQLIGKRWEVINREYTSGDLKWERNNSIIARNIFILSKR